MRPGPLTLLAALCLSAPTGADEISRLEEIYGPGDLAMVSGLGRLTVGVNGRGRISLCKWPTPGYNDQLTYRTRTRDAPALGVEPGHGILWGIRLDGELVWMNDPRWEVYQHYDAPSNSIMVTEARWPNSSIAVTQRVSVLPLRDVLVTELAVSGLALLPQIYWYANFTPCTRHIPEIPVADSLLDALNDFAAFSDPDEGLVVHFRPEKPSKEDWERAKRLTQDAATPGQWRTFKDGTWIGYRGSQGLRKVHCGSGVVTPSQAVGLLPDTTGRPSSASGQTYSVVEIVPKRESDRYIASVVVGFGKNYQQLKDLLDDVAETDAGESFHEIAQFHRRIIDSTVYPDALGQRALEYSWRAQLTLLAARDVNTGSFVRSPAIQPPLARDWPKHGAWIVHAMDLAGDLDIAEMQLKFYLNNIRTEYARGKPIGSLPASTYTDGMEASPHFIVDDEAVAWLLWALKEHSAFLPDARRDEFLESIWEQVVLCADFLAAWKDSRRGAPLWADDPITFRDPTTRERLFAAKLGLDSAISIADEIGRAPAKLWTDRQRQVDNLVRGIVLDQTNQWPVGGSLPMFLDQLAEMDEQVLDQAVTRRLQALDDLSGYDAAWSFAQAAMLWRGQKDKLEDLKPSAERALENSLTALTGDEAMGLREPLFPDALAAALCIVAIRTIYGFDD
ncbi:MAG: hypothetical protein QGD90_09520 [Candidatus Hydrogenedentes bacterium]|nr:hypothetical protein [Candidatus Hydrogenedentota bacterium]